jgi:AhpD family alkylhydroperoxidase
MQKLLVYQSMWAMERRAPDGMEWSLEEKLKMIRDAGFDGAGVRFFDFAQAKAHVDILKDYGLTWQAQCYPQTVDDLKPILDNVEKMLGFVPNLHRLMSISPNVLSGWATLMASLAKTLDIKTRDGIALAVSEADGCDYCLAAHSFMAGNLAKIPADEIELNREGRSTDPKRQAAVAFAKALIETRGKVSDAQFAAVREAGWNRRQHRRDDRADCPVPVDQLHEQCGADPDRLSRGQSREGSLARGALL